MRKYFLFAFAALIVGGSSGVSRAAQAPEFTHHAAADWLNSAPLTLAGLRGRVVLIEFWTFGCHNCRNTLPWLKAIHAQYAGADFEVVSVHTPEFDFERDPAQVRAAIDKLGIRYPVLLDGDSSYWRALENRYWPAFYLLDAEGRIAATAFGELHRGERRGDDFERRIRELLARK